MGTNYYFKPADNSPLAIFGSIHLGKSSGGWSFSFHGYEIPGAFHRIAFDNTGLSVCVKLPELIVKSYADVLKLLATSGRIEDEYGVEKTLLEFAGMVESKRNGQNYAKSYPSEDDFVDAEGHSFTMRDFC